MAAKEPSSWADSRKLKEREKESSPMMSVVDQEGVGMGRGMGALTKGEELDPAA